MKNGVYHVVFDNSYSMVRGKDLVYSVKEMEGIMWNDEWEWVNPLFNKI